MYCAVRPDKRVHINISIYCCRFGCTSRTNFIKPFGHFSLSANVWCVCGKKADLRVMWPSQINMWIKSKSARIHSMHVLITLASALFHCSWLLLYVYVASPHSSECIRGREKIHRNVLVICATNKAYYSDLQANCRPKIISYSPFSCCLRHDTVA